MTHKTNNMKLYTEEQVRDMLSGAMHSHWVDEFLLSYKPIELPSDEEIIKNAPTTPKNADDYLISNKIGFVYGAKWMKKQILNQNK